MAKVTGLKIVNFKGVGQGGLRIEFRPITLLFGANSAGKSTILQALQYAWQIFRNRNLDARKIGDEASETDIGGYANFVHQQDLRRDVVVGLEIALDDNEPLPSFGYQSPDNLDEPSSLYESVKKLEVEVTLRWDRNRQLPFIHLYRVLMDGEMLATSVHHSGRKSLEVVLETSHPVFKKDPDHSALERWKHPCFDDDPDGYSHSPEQSGIRNLLKLANSVGAININPTMALEPGFLEAQRKNPDLKEMLSLRSFWMPIASDDDALPDLANPLPINTDGHGMIDDQDYADCDFAGLALYLREVLSQLVVGPAILARDALSDARFLGQFREVPDREHIRGRAEGDGVWSNGIAAWNLLSRQDRRSLVDTVSDWLSDPDKLGSGYMLRVKEFKEFDLANDLVGLLMRGGKTEDLSDLDRLFVEARSQLTQLPTRVRLLFHPFSDGDANYQVELAPKDLGVGISQIVPVVVAALDSSRTLVAVEQPELHLHPRMQARMGDLFIEGIKAGNRFLLETHSEHLIHRLKRRIREIAEATETNAAGNHELSREDVGIWHVSIKDGEAIARQIDLQENGDFVGPWPDDFFEIGFKERYSC
jgi:hypothetical protein